MPISEARSEGVESQRRVRILSHPRASVGCLGTRARVRCQATESRDSTHIAIEKRGERLAVGVRAIRTGFPHIPA